MQTADSQEPEPYSSETGMSTQQRTALFDAWLSDSMQPEQHQQLEQLLASDDEAARAFRAHVGQQVQPTQQPTPAIRITPWLPALAAALCACAAWLFFS